MGGLKKYYFGKSKYNTIIGGIGATINTPALLATKLGINSSNISSFSVKGVDVYAKINVNYIINESSFKNSTCTFYNDISGKVSSLRRESFRNSPVTYVYFPNCTSVDLGGYLSFYNCIYLTSVYLPKCSSINTQTFQLCTALVTLDLPELTTVFGVFSFANMTSIATINIKKCTSLGSSLGNSNTFDIIRTGCQINVNIALQTNNAGAPDGDLTYAKNTRSAIVNFYNNDGSYNSTL